MSPIAILLDEGVAKAVYKFLQRKGYDTKRIMDLSPRGTKNTAVLTLASDTRRVLFTRDADFLKLPQAGEKRIKIENLDAYPDEPDKLAKHVEAHMENCLTLLNQCHIVVLRREGPECLRL